MVTLADLIEVNAIDLTNNVQEIITKRGEFFSLRYGQETPGKLFRYQEIVKRLMIALDRMMIYHRPGRGKTCSMGGGSEYYHSILLNILDTFDYTQKTAMKLKRVFIVTRAALVERFKEELYRVCSDRYTVQDTQMSKDGVMVKLRASQYKVIRDNNLGWSNLRENEDDRLGYTIMSYGDFENMF